MMRAVAFSLFLLGAGAVRACARRLGRYFGAGPAAVPFGRLPLVQNRLGSQVVVHILTLGSPLLLPEGVRQFLYLLFRGHTYLPNEQAYEEEQAPVKVFCSFSG